MANTRRRSICLVAAAIVSALLLAFIAVPSAAADSAPVGVAAAVEKTHSTVSAKLEDVRAAASERLGVDAEKIEYIWNYGDNVAEGVTAATDDFIAMLEGIGSSYDKGDVEGILSTPKTFIDGLGAYLGEIKDTVIP